MLISPQVKTHLSLSSLRWGFPLDGVVYCLGASVLWFTQNVSDVLDVILTAHQADDEQLTRSKGRVNNEHNVKW
jgi:hypothetical protein